MHVPFLDLPAQYKQLQADIDSAIAAVIQNCSFTLGSAVQQFEADFAAYCNVPYCIGVSSGTAALELILRAYNIGVGDEVITVANTFFATAEAISLVGATPVLVDCNLEDGLINTNQLAAAITNRTKAIIPVHLYGQMADMAPILALAKEHNLCVFEDACQAHGASYYGKPAGSLGHAAAFSFYPGKNLGAYGDAGAITTADEAIAKKLQMLRNHGMQKKYYHEIIGKNDRMAGIQGAVLGVKLPHLSGWNAARRGHAALYQMHLQASGITLLTAHANREHVHHLCVVRVPNRALVQANLAEANIQSGIHYPVPVHLQVAYAHMGWQIGSYPATEALAADILSLPMYPELTAEQIEYVCTTLTQIVNSQV